MIGSPQSFSPLQGQARSPESVYATLVMLWSADHESTVAYGGWWMVDDGSWM